MSHASFFFVLKYLCNPLLHVPSVCSNVACFKVQMTVCVQSPMNSIFKTEEDLNYFGKFVPKSQYFFASVKKMGRQ